MNKTHRTNHLTLTPSSAAFQMNLAAYPSSQLRTKLVGKMLGAG